ncbi:MAG: TolC family protein [Sphingobacteriaceae bacterium]|nr:TolC family protein [Sphingobacteriaceae bacterium]
MKIWIKLFLVLTQLTFAQDVLNYSDALKIAIEKNTSVLVFKNEKQTQHLKNNAGNAGLSPTVSLNANLNFSNLNSYQEFSSGTIQDRTGAKSNNVAASANVNWVIFDGFKMFAVKKKLSSNENISDLQLKKQIEDVIVEITAGYYEVVRLNKLLAVANENLSLLRKRKEISEEKFKIGSGSGIDLLTCKTDENKALSEVYNLEWLIVKSKSELNKALLKDVNEDFKTRDTIEVNFEPNIDELTKLKSQNTGLLISKELEKQAKYSLDESRSYYMPYVQLNGSYNFTRNTSQAGFIFQNRQNGISAGLSAGWTIFNGNKNSRMYKEKQIALLNTALNTTDLNKQYESIIYINVQAFLTHKKIYKLELANLNDSRELLTVADERYKIGRSDLIQVREAQKNFTEAQSRCINSLYNLKMAEVELLRTSGQLIK